MGRSVLGKHRSSNFVMYLQLWIRSNLNQNLTQTIIKMCIEGPDLYKFNVLDDLLTSDSHVLLISWEFTLD